MRIKKGFDRRLKAGHPWVYSNELEGSPKGLEPGAVQVLTDASGAFLARGYANPHSLISFRVVSRDEKEADALDPAGVARRVDEAWGLREALGRTQASFRLVFGEADRLPGLVIDALRIGEKSQSASLVFVVQPHTAGADRWVSAVVEVLPALAKKKGEKAPIAVLVRRDASFRKQEGISIAEPEWLVPSPAGLGPDAPIWVAAAGGALGEAIPFQCDWISGQKTGFFLDQADNVEKLIHRVRRSGLKAGAKVRVLDLCCYVGQWSAQLAKVFQSMGVEAEFTLVDASAQALEYARANVAAQGAARVVTQKKDVLHELADLPAGTFDIVISDPPALVKSRKDLGPGTHAYLQLHTQALRLLKKGGWIAACSCSGLLPEEEFVGTLSKAARRNETRILWVERGSQAVDHPWDAAFPEGRYLKCAIGRRSH